MQLQCEMRDGLQKRSRQRSRVQLEALVPANKETRICGFESNKNPKTVQQQSLETGGVQPHSAPEMAHKSCIDPEFQRSATHFEGQTPGPEAIHNHSFSSSD